VSFAVGVFQAATANPMTGIARASWLPARGSKYIFPECLMAPARELDQTVPLALLLDTLT
jgi:hypothetical protein